MKAIAGEDAYSGLLALIKTSPEAYKQMADTITNSAGSSHEAYMKMQDTLKGSIDAMMGSVEALGISFARRWLRQYGRRPMRWGNFADLINGMSPEAKSMVISIAGGIIAFTGLSFAVSRVLTFSGMLVRTYGDIGRVMAGQTIRNKALQVAVQGLCGLFL